MRQPIWALCTCLLAILPVTSCGTPGAPLPPSLELPMAVTDLRAARKGDKVYLTWTVPSKTTERQTVRHLGPTRICRSVGTGITDCGQPVGEVAASQFQPPNSLQHKAGSADTKVQASYIDRLPQQLQAQNPTGELTYAVAVLNESGRASGLSNQVKIPAGATFPPPLNWNAQLTPNGVVLSWEGIPRAADENAAVRHMYRIYRREDGSTKDTTFPEIALGVPSQPMQFIDRSFEWEKTYFYRVTVATEVKLGTQHPCPPTAEPEAALAECADYLYVEGEDSPVMRVLAHDIFPPNVPSDLQAVASGVGQAPFIDLIWAPDSEADLAGYNVYRNEEGGQAVKINSDLVTTPAYRDASVQPGKKYFYSVSAVDLRGNESARSEPASETTP